MTSTIIFETFLDPAGFKTYQYIAEYVERYVHVPAFLLNGEALEVFAAAYADVGFITPLAYVWLLSHKPCPVELIAAAVQYGVQEDDVPLAFLDVVTCKGSMLDLTNDVEKSVWAYYVEGARVEDHWLKALLNISLYRENKWKVRDGRI